MPLSAVLIALAEPLVLCIFGDQWYGAIFPFQMFISLMFGVAVGSLPSIISKAIGRPLLTLYSNLLQGILLIGGVILIHIQGYGLELIVAWMVAVQLFISFLFTGIMAKLLQISFVTMWKVHGPSFLNATVCGSVVLFLVKECREQGLNNWTVLLLCSVFFSCLYVLFAWYFDTVRMKSACKLFNELVIKHTGKKIAG
jgi:O-antigen/teichoic acid export membrane protein